jgi:hypothetical protein
MTKIFRLLLYAILEREIYTATAESAWGLGFVYIFSLFSFESSIVISFITLYLYINTSFSSRNNN